MIGRNHNPAKRARRSSIRWPDKLTELRLFKPSRPSGDLLPKAKIGNDSRCLAREHRRPFAHVGETRIAGLSASVAGVDLLDHGRRLPVGPRPVVVGHAYIPPAAPGVALEHLLAL